MNGRASSSRPPLLGVALVAIVAAFATRHVSAQAAPDIDTLLTRVGERIAEYYKRAQNVICTEKSTVQPVGRDYAPDGFARVTEYELRVESDANADGENVPEARVVRQLLKVNGRLPREKDSKDHASCTDSNPLSTEPLVFLLPSHRSEYTFVSGGVGKGKDRNTFVIEFSQLKPEGEAGIVEDPKGREGCYSVTLPVTMKGRVWVDAASYQVIRVEQRLSGMADIRVPTKLQRKRNLSDAVIVERQDTTIRYKSFQFHDPDEAMLLPESIETLWIVRGSFMSTRSRQVFTDYRRFMTGARIVK